MKNLKTYILAITAILTVFASQAADFTFNGIAYNIISLARQTCEVTGKGGSLYYSGDIVIPEKVTDSYDNTEYTVIAIGKDAFSFSTDLKSLQLPNTIREIKKNAFGSCGLTTLVIPQSCTVLDESAFWGASINTISIPGGIRKVGDHCFRMCRQLAEITLEEGVDSIGNYALYGCETLTKVNFPKSLTTIGEISFGSCTALENIEMPAGLVNVGKGMFVGCVKLQSIGASAESQTLKSDNGILYSKDGSILYEYPFGKPGTTFDVPVGTKTIWANAFQKNPSLTSIRLADDTEVLGDYCFNEIPGLESIDFGKSLLSIGSYALMNLPGIKEFKFPATLKSISQMAVSKNTGLTKIELPNSVETLGDYAFFGCEKVTEIHLGTGLKQLDKVVFQRCYGVNEVFCAASVPPVCSGMQFQDDNYKKAKLHVPVGTADAYKSADGWKEFSEIIGDIESAGVKEITGDGMKIGFGHGVITLEGDSAVEIFDASGLKVYDGRGGEVRLPSGLYIVRTSTETVKVIL